ncbi:MAG: precorrin-6y C5,15-methyltransferase (decarboxylating) subunit CbiE [Leptospirillia bacterium]
MAKEIILIGVGPEGRDSLLGSTLDIIRESHLIIGGKRVISQFEDLGVPTYAMTANLRQLVDIIDSSESAVVEGREIRIEQDLRQISDSEGEPGEDEGDGSQEGGRSSGRRRSRRRPSPRSRGRRSEGKEGDNSAPDSAGDGTPKAGEGDAPKAEAPSADTQDTKPDSKSDGGAKVIDAPNDTASLSAPVAVPQEDAPEDASNAAPAADAAASTETKPDAAEDSAGATEGDTTVTDDKKAAPEAEPAGTPEPAAPGDTEAVSGDKSSRGRRARGTAKQDEAGEKKDDSPVARVVILASGDPNFFGLSKFLLERFKKEEITIVPHVSAIQMAFAAIKEPMNDAAVTSSAGRNVDRLIRVVRQNAKVGIFTDKRRSPRAVAKLLLKHDIEAQCYVCQDLGTPRERIIMGSLEEISRKNFSPLSIMILFKSADDESAADNGVPARKAAQKETSKDDGRQRGRGANLKELPAAGKAPKYALVSSLGVPDEMLAARPEKMMRAEMRVIVLSKLRLEEKHRFWDVGAGAGALTVEAARVAHGGEVLSIERDFTQTRNIYENIKGFGLDNVTVVEGDVEEMAAGLPEPDRVFVGGCGGHMKNVVEICLKRLKSGGIMVINATTLDALSEVQTLFKESRLKHDMVIVNIARTVERGGLEYFEGFNPAYLITTVKD